MAEQSKRTKYAFTALQLAIVLAVMLFIPTLIGLGKGGFDIKEVLTQFFFYSGLGVGFAVIVILLTIATEFMNGGGSYGTGLGFDSIGDAPHPKSDLFRGRLRLALACIIIFSILGLFAGATKQTYFGVGSLQQQFTKLDSTIYNGSLVASSENLGAAGLIALIIFGLRRAAQKYGWSKNNFIILSWVLVVGGTMLYGVINHLLRYSTDDLALLNVAGVWGIGAVMTMLTGSFIPFWILHIVNNVFFSLGSAFSRDVTQIWIIGFIVLMTVLFLWLYVFRSKRSYER